MWAHLQDEPPTVTAVRPDLPAAIDAVIARALAKDPEKRYETCTAMVAAARAALLPDAIVAPAAVTRAHGEPGQRPPDATRVNRANAAPPLAAPPLAAAPGPAAAPPLAAPTDERRGRRPRRPRRRPRRPRRRRPARAVPGAGERPLVARGRRGRRAIGKGGGDKPAPAAGKVAANDQLELTYKAPWISGRRRRRRPGPRADAPDRPRHGDGRIVAGRIAKPGPGLLPDGVAGRARPTRSSSASSPPCATPAFRPAAGVSDRVRGPHRPGSAGDRLHERRGRRRARRSRRRCTCARPRPSTSIPTRPTPPASAAAGRPEPAARAPTAARWRAARTGKAQAVAAASAAAHQAALAKRARAAGPGHAAGRQRRGRRRDRRDRAAATRASPRPPAREDAEPLSRRRRGAAPARTPTSRTRSAA